MRPAGSAPDTPGWRVRVFANRYPAVEHLDALVAARDARAHIFTAVAASGAHEVIVNSPRAVEASPR